MKNVSVFFILWTKYGIIVIVTKKKRLKLFRSKRTEGEKVSRVCKAAKLYIMVRVNYLL